ncbi:hypothetical protein ASE11_01510 [Hydrogenophaga sp. Root209]|uniref:hypothetical protein n=1 Tax=Hydrogenophaga sp. Root209 TaxID=1736490 RepID=UPI0006FE7641|nr:hypothetical protein [Hydrogenophaga sp. Root209]KRC12173.1 hypothetical protein ASE11_01510 [Hydrogenophaga sp. Root209]
MAVLWFALVPIQLLAETRCFDVPYFVYTMPETFTPAEQRAHEFIGHFRYYRGHGTLEENTAASLAELPPLDQGTLPNGGSLVQWLSPDITMSTDLYLDYDQHLYTAEVHAVNLSWTGCTAQGSCRHSEYVNFHRGCVTATYTPYLISLDGSSRTIDKDLTPIDLTLSLSLNGRPAAHKPVSIVASDQGRHGFLRCKGTCAGFMWQTNDEGLLLLEYVPTQPASERIEFVASCANCGNTANWVVQPQRDIVIGFFNGVANTQEAALDSLDRLEEEFGPQYKDTPLKYDWFYNQTACGEGVLGKPSCLEDVAEVFDQRTRELGGVFASRWETFWDILAGSYQQETSFTGRLLDRLGNSGNALLQWLDAGLNAILNQLARDTFKLITLFKDSPTYENRASHMERLWRYADEGHGMVLVAHSQGNLFVNSAFDALKAFKPEAQAQVVHVAPASPTLRGDHVLADIDLVINALRVTGLNSVPDVNINLPVSKIDRSGHGFEPTYLDTARAAYARTRGLIVQSLDALVN